MFVVTSLKSSGAPIRPPLPPHFSMGGGRAGRYGSKACLPRYSTRISAARISVKKKCGGHDSPTPLVTPRWCWVFVGGTLDSRDPPKNTSDRNLNRITRLTVTKNEIFEKVVTVYTYSFLVIYSIDEIMRITHAKFHVKILDFGNPPQNIVRSKAL